MRGTLLLGGGRPTAWTTNTSYVGISGLNNENSPPTLGRRRKEDSNFKEILSAIETMHRKEMQSYTTNRKHLEKSMMAYSERMRELNKGRRSLPVIITPASGEKPFTHKKFSDIIRPDALSPTSDHMEHGSSQVSVASSGNSIRHYPRKLSPFAVQRNQNRKMTYHGSEIERHLLSPNMHSLRHSISGTGSNHSGSSVGTRRTRKVTTISPPDPSDFTKTRDTKSRDSAYESFNESDMECEHRDKLNPDDMDVDTHSASSVKISCFPDIKEARKHINKVFGVGEEFDETKIIRKKKKMRKVPKKLESDEEPKTSKYLKRQRKYEKKEKQEIAETIIETYFDEEEEKEEQEEIEEEPEEKKKREVCYGFRYSVSIKELLKKPNPFNLSKKEMIYKVEMENGRIVNTLGAGVLKVVEMDKFNNIRGVPLNIKRDEPMSKRKKAAANLSRSVSRANPLPPLSRGASRDDNSSEMDQQESSRTKTSLYENPIASSLQSPSTVMVIGADA